MISVKRSRTFSDRQEEQTQADQPFCVVLILLPLSVLEKLFFPKFPCPSVALVATNVQRLAFEHH